LLKKPLGRVTRLGASWQPFSSPPLPLKLPTHQPSTERDLSDEYSIENRWRDDVIGVDELIGWLLAHNSTARLEPQVKIPILSFDQLVAASVVRVTKVDAQLDGNTGTELLLVIDSIGHSGELRQGVAADGGGPPFVTRSTGIDSTSPTI
jgi:hypothetical protein